MSGKEAALPPPPPLGTVQAGFLAYGSSFHERLSRDAALFTTNFLLWT
jgi:hypothetical protein